MGASGATTLGEGAAVGGDGDGAAVVVEGAVGEVGGADAGRELDFEGAGGGGSHIRVAGGGGGLARGGFEDGSRSGVGHLRVRAGCGRRW